MSELEEEAEAAGVGAEAGRADFFRGEGADVEDAAGCGDEGFFACAYARVLKSESNVRAILKALIRRNTEKSSRSRNSRR